MTSFQRMTRIRAIGTCAIALGTFAASPALAGGRSRVGVSVDIGRTAVVPVTRVIVEPAVYETREQRVWVEPVYRTEIVEVPVPALYEKRIRRVWVPAVTEVRKVPATIPAVYEERTTEIRKNGKKSVVRERVLLKPATTIMRDQTFVVRPGHWREEAEKICVRPASIRREERQVLITPGRWTTVVQRVCIRPETRRTVIDEVPTSRGGFYLGIGVDRHRHGRGVHVGVGVGR